MFRRFALSLVVLLVLGVVVAPAAQGAVAPSISGPAVVTRYATVALSGHAGPRRPVQVWFHKRGEVFGRYTLRRNLMTDAAGNYRTSYIADTDYRYYASSDGLTSLPGLTVVRYVTVTGPGTAPAGSTVTIRGVAMPPGSLVGVWFHRRGQPAGFYSRRRVLHSDGAGNWSTSYVADTDYRYYATANGLTSSVVLTQASSASCSNGQVWQNLDACGWPGPGSTGYPAGQVFSRTINGGLTITANGTVINGYKVTGGIQVRAQNVVIKNSWIVNSAGGANGSGVVNINPGYSATVDHSVLDGSNATHACIWDEGSSMVATSNECRGVNDGIFSWATEEGVDGTGDHFRIEGNWLHAFTTEAANGHVDGYQTEGAKHGIIRHNVIDVSQDQNAAISVWNGRKSSDDILIDNNLLAGGGFTVYAEDYSPSEQSPGGGYTVTNVRITNNKFSTVHFGCVGYWGVWFPRGAPSDGWRRSGNVVLETSQRIDDGNPTYRGAGCN